MGDPVVMRKQVYKHMLETRGWKYRAFLRYLRLFKYVALAPTRGDFLESYYVLMRYLDDIVDGDAPLPSGYSSERDYLIEKIKFTNAPVNPKDGVDHLILHCFGLAEKFNEEFVQETDDILKSLLFDVERRGKRIVFPEKELMHHFHLLDIRGTIRATLKVFKDDPDKYKLLEPLGVASRYQFDIEDIDTDLENGYINISQEECDLLGITHDDLKDPESPKVRTWLYTRAKKGIELLEEHHRVSRQGKFSFLQRLTFSWVYENPARRVFEEVITEYERSNG